MLLKCFFSYFDFRKFFHNNQLFYKVKQLMQLVTCTYIYSNINSKIYRTVNLNINILKIVRILLLGKNRLTFHQKLKQLKLEKFFKFVKCWD